MQLSPSGTSSVPGSFFVNAIEKKAKPEYSEFSSLRAGIPFETPSGHENFPYVALNLKKVSRVRTEIARSPPVGPCESVHGGHVSRPTPIDFKLRCCTRYVPSRSRRYHFFEEIDSALDGETARHHCFPLPIVHCVALCSKIGSDNVRHARDSLPCYLVDICMCVTFSLRHSQFSINYPIIAHTRT